MEKNFYNKQLIKITNYNELHEDTKSYDTLPSLPKIEHYPTTTFSELLPYISAGTDFISQEDFEVFIQVNEREGVRYICKFANLDSAERNFINACNTEDLDKFEIFNDRLGSEMVYILNIHVEPISQD